MALLIRADSSTGRGAARAIAGAVLAALLCAPASELRAQADELRLKSAFLYKFLHYAEWPPDALGGAGDPIALCVIADDALAEVLDEAVRGRTSHERPLVVRRVAAADADEHCHVLFVGASEPERIDRVLDAFAERPTLTVGDAEGFAGRGGMINFVRRGARLGFEINRDAVARAGLQLSSQLLKLARLVPDESEGE